MKRLKFTIILLGLLSIFLFVTQEGDNTFEKTQKYASIDHPVILKSNPDFQIVDALSSDMECSEDNSFSSSLGLIHFDLFFQPFPILLTRVVCNETSYTGSEDIPLYILYHSLKANLS